MLKLDVIEALEKLKGSKVVEITTNTGHIFKVNYEDIVNFEKDEVLEVPNSNLRFLYSSIGTIRHVF